MCVTDRLACTRKAFCVHALKAHRKRWKLLHAFLTDGLSGQLQVPTDLPNSCYSSGGLVAPELVWTLWRG